MSCRPLALGRYLTSVRGLLIGNRLRMVSARRRPITVESRDLAVSGSLTSIEGPTVGLGLGPVSISCRILTVVSRKLPTYGSFAARHVLVISLRSEFVPSRRGYLAVDRRPLAVDGSLITIQRPAVGV